MSKKNKNEDKKFEKDLKQVQDQYLDYPYPKRNPEDEKRRLLSMQADSLSEINHYLWGGRQDFKKNFIHFLNFNLSDYLLIFKKINQSSIHSDRL